MTLEKHTPYEERRGHPCDFKVKYRFYSEAEGGRKTIPHQGIRCDFYYEHSDHAEKNDRFFRIWPEFEMADGSLIDSGIMPAQGVARMWIVDPSRREYHSQRIAKGTKGWFKEGLRSTPECEVIQLVGLATNPTN